MCPTLHDSGVVRREPDAALGYLDMDLVGEVDATQYLV